MFGGGGNKFKSAKVDTLIGQSAVIEGDVVYQGGLHIDGTVKGNVLADDESQSMLILSERGCVEGEIRVPNVLLNGQVNGDVYACERVEIARHAKVDGNVYYNLLEMAMGAQINGHLLHRKKEEQRLLEHKGEDDKDAAAAAAKGSGQPAAPHGVNS